LGQEKIIVGYSIIGGKVKCKDGRRRGDKERGIISSPKKMADTGFSKIGGKRKHPVFLGKKGGRTVPFKSTKKERVSLRGVQKGKKDIRRSGGLGKKS